MESVWVSLLRRARSGSMLYGQVGAEGSANWSESQTDPVPATLTLCDLHPPLAFEEGRLPDFPQEFATTVEELDLSGNALVALPDNIHILKKLRRLFLGGPAPGASPTGRPNRFLSLPSLAGLECLEALSVHDTALQALPPLPMSLRTLRVDRCPLQHSSLEEELMVLPPLTTLHLEGCTNVHGTAERPDLLPRAIKRLEACLADLQLPDGFHLGHFFGTPLSDAIARAQTIQVANDKQLGE